MNQEIKNCQNCKQDFTIEPEDFNFYEKIKVPPPTFCPECRRQRRMTWRNIRNLYKIGCSAPGHDEKILAVYSDDKPQKVYDYTYWWSDDWDPLHYGMEYDFSVPFFVQFKKLLDVVPLPNVSNLNAIQSEYCNVTVNSKNCYLVFSGFENENCMFAEGISKCKDSLDLLSSTTCERCYQNIDCHGCYEVKFSLNAIDCINSSYLYDCRNCSNCLGCWNLRNKQFNILNEQFSEEEYKEKLKEIEKNYKNFEKEFKKSAPRFIHRCSQIINSKDCTGDHIVNSKNCTNSFDIERAEDSKNVWRLLETGSSDSHDITIATSPKQCYEGLGTGGGYDCKFGVATADSSESNYIFTCIAGGKKLFGCVGINHKSYCILNKQYTKEEYEELVPRIIEHMQKTGEWGEFFPPQISPFAYNEALSNDWLPLKREEALAQGQKWRDPDPKEFSPQDYQVTDDITQVGEDILQQVLACEKCGQNYKIVPAEFAFYKKYVLPIPELCPSCRHIDRMKKRNPRHLWNRKCMNEGCQNEFETTYAPDRSEKVYCESCYQKEVL